MSGKSKIIIRKIAKVIKWATIVLLFLFVFIAGLIQFPIVQTKIIRSATSIVSHKTNTNVEIEKVSISFPKSVVIEGLFLEDLNMDTLVYVDQLKVNISLFDLFYKKLNVSSFELNDMVINVYNTKADSIFNYDILLSAFGDTSTVNQDSSRESSWIFNLGKLNLHNVRFHYHNAYQGIHFNSSLKKLMLKMDEIDLVKSIYRTEDLNINGLAAKFQMEESQYPLVKNTDENISKILPKIIVHKVLFENTSLSYEDHNTNETLFADIHQFELKKSLIDLEDEILELDKFSLVKSNIQLSIGNSIQAIDSSQNNVHKPSQNNWKVSVKSVALDDNTLAFQQGNEKRNAKAFNTKQQYYEHLTLLGDDLEYSSEKLCFSIKEFTAVDQNQFAITQFETDFLMLRQSIALKKLKVSTTHSSIIGELDLKYASLESLLDSLPFLMVNINLENLNLYHQDLLYFSPELAKQPFFENKSAITTFSGFVSGPVNHLSGKNLLLTTGNNTKITTDFTIKGLTDISTAHFYFPNLIITSGKKDLAVMLGASLPENLDLPEELSLKIDFNGTINDFKSGILMDGSFGAAHLFVKLNKDEKYLVKLSLKDFNLGRFINDTARLGPVSLALETKGQGLAMENISASIKGEVSSIYFNKYNYHQLSVDGDINSRKFQGEFSMNDKNAVINFDGLVDFTPAHEQFNFNLDVKHLDLFKLHFTDDDIQVALSTTADLSGVSVNTLNGTAGITNLSVVQNGEKYELDSLMITVSNELNRSELIVRSPLLGLEYLGTLSPSSVPLVLNQFVSDYFQFSDSLKTDNDFKSDSFSFQIQLRKHPLLTEVLFPELVEFEPGNIIGSFDGKKRELKLNTAFKNVTYGEVKVKNINLDMSSDSNAINYKFSTSSITNPQLRVDHFLVEGKIADHKIEASFSSTDDQQNKKLLINSLIERDSSNYKISLDPHDFYLMDEPWNIATDNYILFGEQGFLIHKLNLSKLECQINVTSANQKFNDDLSITGINFKLNDILGIVLKDSNLVRGTVNGNVLLKRVNESYGIIANSQIDQLFFTGVPIGNLMVKAENPKAEQFDIAMNLSGAGNELTANGYFNPLGGDSSIQINIDIPSLSMKTIEAFSMGQILEASGTVSGHFLIKGTPNLPKITGELVFNNAFIKPTILNNRIELKHETIQLKNDGIYFNAFTLLDINQNSAIIDGSLKMKRMNDMMMALQIKTQDFLLINTTAKDNKQFFGKMIIDSKIDLSGSLSLPVINANIKMKKGSVYTIAVPKNNLTNSRGQGVVEFVDRSNSKLSRKKKNQSQQSSHLGVDLSSILEVDKNAKLKLLIDPTSNDSLVVQGEAALSFMMDRSGKMSLTGAYELSNGNYMVSLESIVKRRFKIEEGSTINWQGDPLDAGISIDATYLVRTSPVNLVSDQMTGENEAGNNAYKQRYPFLVILKLRGEILNPEISFEIKLLPEDKGILGGSVDAKLSLLNENPSELNKQVFALLVLGRFVQENPLVSGSNDEASAVVRATVSKFLSAELNKWSSKMVPGVELSFDVRSYDDYQSNQAVGRTQVDIGLKKQLFDDRLSVKIGGVVDVEGAKAKQNSVSDITSDVSVEYELTKDGRYRLIGFSHNQYEGAIEGQVIETGVGIIYIRDFDKWKNFFKTQKQEK